MILESASDLQRKGLSLICSYLPNNTYFETTVHLASYIFLSGPDTSEPKYAPSAFVVEPDIIVNLSSKFWTYDVNEVFNMLTHEIYHIGFNTKAAFFRPNLEDKSKKELVKSIIWMLQYEGMATYIGFKALPLFPTPDKKGEGSTVGGDDYKMLQNIQDVRRLLEKVNHLFLQSESKSYGEYEEMIRQEGVMQRAFYVVGAYIAQEIEASKGTEALVQSTIKGPRHYVDSYNNIAPNSMQVLIR